MNINKLVIKKVRRHQELLDVQNLHKIIWGLADLEVTPTHILLAVQRANGIVLCAYYERKPIGFSFGFCGINDANQLYLHSHNIGVLEEFRNFGVGYEIKRKQYEIALTRGIDLIAWTFDPLDSRNAYFNFNKLRCISRKYTRDYYGPMPDQLNKDLPSDRLIVEWRLKNEKTINSLGGAFRESNRTLESSAIILNDMRIGATGQPISVINKARVEEFLIDEFGRCYIEIPSDYQEMRQRNFDLVIEWRIALRYMLEQCFSYGFFISGFNYVSGRSFFELEKTLD